MKTLSLKGNFPGRKPNYSIFLGILFVRKIQSHIFTYYSWSTKHKSLAFKVPLLSILSVENPRSSAIEGINLFKSHGPSLVPALFTSTLSTTLTHSCSFPYQWYNSHIFLLFLALDSCYKSS